jgi:HEAT repeat protein
LIKYLKKTDNIILRNEIAIALADIGNDKAVEPLIYMLKHSKTKGSRGTLLYALEDLDYIQHVELLVELLYEDNFEVNRHALMLIESISTKISDEVLQRCTCQIKEKIDFLSESLDALSRQ